jgi:predicted GIY-YIG superfamily endonuclease
MAGDKRFVYVLRNSDHNPKFYVGLTSEVKARLADPNAGHSSHTASRRPWQLHVVIEFSDEARALRFERYLKSGSGRAFAKQRPVRPDHDALPGPPQRLLRSTSAEKTARSC